MSDQLYLDVSSHSSNCGPLLQWHMSLDVIARQPAPPFPLLIVSKQVVTSCTLIVGDSGGPLVRVGCKYRAPSTSPQKSTISASKMSD